MLGRDALLDQIDELMSEGVPLASLVGPGGIGKTRLSRAILERRGGVFVDLSECTSSDDMIAALATALDVPRSSDPARLTDQLVTAIGHRGGIVVLDNAETVLDAVRVQAATLLDSGVSRLLVTSREALGLSTERVVAVGPLQRADARTLFLQRADPQVVGASTDPGEVDELLAGLGGNPLAVELAAGRTLVQGLASIRRALEDGDPLGDLEGQHPDRHASLDALVRSSWDLLDAPDRETLSALAVFRGSFRFEDAVGLDLPPTSIRRLHRASLLHREIDEGGQVWFRLLDEVRRWVRHQAPAPAEARLRHTAWVAERSRRLADRFMLVDSVADRQALGRLVPELLAAFTRSSADTEPRVLAGVLRGLLTWQAEFDLPGVDRLVEPILDRLELLPPFDRAWVTGRLATSLRRRGRAAEGLELVERALDTPEINDVAPARHHLEIRHAHVCLYLARAPEARERLQALLPALEEERELADALRIQGTAARMLGDVDAGTEALRRCVRICERQQVLTLRVVAIAQLMLATDDLAECEALAERALELLADSSSYDAIRAMLLGNHVVQLIEIGALERAAEVWSEAEILVRVRGDLEVAVHLRARLAAAAVTLHDLERAESELTSCLVALVALEVPRSKPWVLAGLGVVAHLRGDLEDAGLRYAEAIEAGEAIGLRDPVACARIMRSVLQAELGEEVQPTGEQPVATSLIGWLLGEVDRGALDAAVEQAGITVIERWLAAVTSAAGARRPAWRISEDGTTVVSPAGGRVDLSRRGKAQRVLAHLLDLRLREPGAAVPAEDLIEVGWPGERILPEAARTRLYAVIRDLRKRGLETVLQTTSEGYRLDPSLEVERI